MIGVTVYDLLPLLPAPSVLREHSRSLAVLDAVFGSRYPRHMYHEKWAPDGTSLARMDNGGGDSYRIAFAEAGTFLIGFDHECAISPYGQDSPALWPGLLDGLPDSLA